MPEFWVFGYGSLMWKPGFAFLDSEPALLRGLHRRLCVLSHVHRGTPERPGLVLGLDRGGSCHGMAFRIGPEHRAATLDYLRAREQVTMVYLEQVKPITLIGSGRRVEAVTYVVDRSHRQYAGRLDDAQL
ncbi:MAG: gamma-glutamylcyclotransferase, partial [Aestuariivirga sp.]